MDDARELRARAAHCRRAARIGTVGGGTVDRILLSLAERLEQQASAVEQKPRQEQAPQPGY